MTFDLPSFIHFVFVGFVALFPVVNPVGSAFIVSPYFSGLTKQEKFNAVKRVSLYAFSICLVSLITGHWILQLFGISIPIIKLAGGIMICKLGWEFLAADKKEQPEERVDERAKHTKTTNIENSLFYPITFPITTGAGTISVLFTLSAHGSDKNFYHYLINTGAILIAVIGMCILVFVCYINANRLIKYLGSQREKIINNIMAFLIFCVGLQIVVEGITQLVQLTSGNPQ